MSSIPPPAPASKRELKLKISLRALNIVRYPDRMATFMGSSAPTPASRGAPQAQAGSSSAPAAIDQYAFGRSLQPNADIDAPYNTFIYGGSPSLLGYDLLADPSSSSQLSFPFSEKYGSRVVASATTPALTLPTLSNENVGSAFAPVVPSRKGIASTSTPRVTTFNFWSHASPGGEAVSGVQYTSSGNPIYSDTWNMGTISQSVDPTGQAQIAINANDNKSVAVRRVYSQRFDALYEDASTIVYPNGSGISNTRYNSRDGRRIINPRENLGFMMTFSVTELAGSGTDRSSNRGVKIQWGDLDTYRLASENSRFIEHYEVVWHDTGAPLLRFWSPVFQDFRDVPLVGPTLKQGIFRIYVHYAGPNLLIGFDDDVAGWNTVSPIQPGNDEEQFKSLYHLTPGGRTDARHDSSVLVEFNNIKVGFKYAAVAFKNTVAGQSPPSSLDFFSEAADDYKVQEKHKFVVSVDFLKKISQSDRLQNFFHSKGCRLHERLSDTEEYAKKSASKYFFSSDILAGNVDRDLASIFFARDWRMASPFDSSYGNSDDGNPWEIKAKILEPDYDTLDDRDIASASNTSVAFVFDSPVYSPVFFEMNTLTMPVDDIKLNSRQKLAETQSDTLSGLQSDDSEHVNLIVQTGQSWSGAEGALYTPIFPFRWGDITDLVRTDKISVSHSIDADGIGRSNTSFSMPNLIFSNRGADILNMIENNLLVVRVQAGYESSKRSGGQYGNDLPVYFEGVIKSVDTQRGALGSNTICQCQDWFSYVLDRAKAFAVFSLQGVRVRDRITMAMKLAGLNSYYQILDRDGDPLHEDPICYGEALAEIENKAFATALSFRQGNATSKSAAQSLSEAIDIDTPLGTFVTESIQFVLDDRALACIYGNNRHDYLPKRTDPSKCESDLDAVGPTRLKVVVENRFLNSPIEPIDDKTSTRPRSRDDFKFLVSPTKVEGEEFVSGAIDSVRMSSMDIEDFHRCIISNIRTNSLTDGLHEGVYLLAVGFGSVPIFHVRSSDSYMLGLAQSQGSTADAALYATGNNRSFRVPVLYGGFFDFNLLEYMDEGLNLTITAEDRFLNRRQFSMGYVGFRKRMFDDLKQTYIQTQSDLVERGNLWAQYIRKVVQNVQFSSIVTRPLEHYNNFRIKGFQSFEDETNSDALSDRHRGTFPSVFFEFHNFLYSQVTYNIDKSDNIVTADVQGAVIPKFGRMELPKADEG